MEIKSYFCNKNFKTFQLKLFWIMLLDSLFPIMFFTESLVCGIRKEVNNLGQCFRELVVTSTENHRLHSSKSGSSDLFFPHLKSPVFSSRYY